MVALGRFGAGKMDFRDIFRLVGINKKLDITKSKPRHIGGEREAS